MDDTRIPILHKAHWWLVTAAACLCCLLTGCIISPVPMSKKMIAAAGAPDKNAIDLSFLNVTKTTAAEVTEKLSAVSVVQNDRFFFGRWATSGSGWIWIAGGGYGEVVGGGWRNWKMHNLMIQFDDRGVVRYVAKVSDNQLVRELATRPTGQKTCTSFETSCEIEIRYHRRLDRGPEFQVAELVFSRARFSLRTHGMRNHDFDVPPEEIVSLSRAGMLRRDSGKPDPDYIEQSLRFKHKTNAGGLITFKITPSDLLLLVDYLKQNRPSALGKTSAD